MRIGPLRNRITFEQKGTTSAGSFVNVGDGWTEVKKVYAQFRQGTAGERDENDQTVAVTSAEFLIRVPRTFSINEKMRVVFRGQNYYITGIRPGNAEDHTTVVAQLRDNE